MHLPASVSEKAVEEGQSLGPCTPHMGGPKEAAGFLLCHGSALTVVISGRESHQRMRLSLSVFHSSCHSNFQINIEKKKTYPTQSQQSSDQYCKPMRCEILKECPDLDRKKSKFLK